MRAATFLVGLLALAAAPAPAPAPTVLDVLETFDRLAGAPLWPGFAPGTVAVEVFDGARTYLVHHPKPPEGFQPVPGRPGTFVFDGKHDSIRANTGTELNGVPTATADLSTARSKEAAAALLVHECFHVHQKAAHPDWTANEAELFTYPVDDATILAERRQETLALVRALQARKDEDARCWARTALAVRGKRAASLPEGALAYERGIEKNEGLAQYVEDLSLHAGARLTDADFPAEEIRQRGYGTGQAWALLLDRFGDWKAGLGATPLDEVLRARLGSEGAVCALSPDAIRSATARAERDAAEVLASRGMRRSAFLAAPGWTVEIVAGEEPLWPQGFDPWNVKNLGERAVLHTRWVKVGNGAGSVEVLDRPSLTEGVGPHPLFNGARRLVVTGLAEPALTEGEGQVGIEAKGLKGSFRGRVERGERRIRLLLP